jgi:hypothetical protein
MPSTLKDMSLQAIVGQAGMHARFVAMLNA